MRKLYLFFAMLFTFAISFNIQSQETVIAVWDFADNSVDGAIHADFASAANPNLTYLQSGGSGDNAFTNTDETGGDLDMSYTMSTTSANANGWSNYILNNLQLGPSSATPTAGSGLVGDKIHFSVSFKEITIAQGSGDKVTFVLKNSNGGNGAAGGTNEGAGTNQRITGLQIAENGSNNTTLKASTFIINGGNNNGTTKLCGHFGVTQGYTLTDLTIGVTVDYSVGSIRFWIDSPDTYASGDGNAWGFKMYNSDGWANTSGFPALTATPAAGAGLAEAVVQMMQFSPVFQDAGSKMVVDQIKISTGTYENTVAAGNTVTPSTTSIPWSNGLESGLDDLATAQTGDTDANWVQTDSRANSGTYSVFHDDANGATGYVNWLLTPTFDLSGATTPQLTYFDNVNYVTWAETHEVMYSTDYTDDVSAATWTNLNNTIGTEDAWVENGPYDLPTGATVTVAFKYTGDYASEWYIDDISVAEAPTAPGADWTVTPAAGLSDSATVSMTTENFTVAATDGGGDGHWHYTLDGGSTVMMYDTNDVALTGLSSGEHTLVAWLVDNSHQALDPAVEETITWTQTTAPGCGESLSYDYTTGSSGGYNFDVNFTAADAGDLLFTSTVDNAGDHITVTVGGSTESGYDWVYVTDGAGNVLLTPVSGAMDSSVTSTDGTINVYLASDSSVTSGPVTFDVSCAAATAAVTFTVNTQNITVGDNGMYLGGGVLGDAMAYAMTDADADGTWEVTVDLAIGLTGEYIFLNSPNDGGDWGAKEDLSGQDCAVGQYNDRGLPEIAGDMTIQHCFGSCESDGTCPAASTTSDITFNVNMNAYGLQAGDTVHVNGEFTGWCGSCDGNQMTDDDGDGIYTVTMALEDGSYFWKYTVNAWGDQEGFSEAVDGCTADNNGNFDRQLVVAGADQTVTYCWNSCSDSGCDALQLQGIMDFNITDQNYGVNGAQGKAVHVVAMSDIADLSVYGIGVANNGGGTDGQEWTFPAQSAAAGDNIIVVRSVQAMDDYMNVSAEYSAVIEGSSSISQNGDDAIELFKNGNVIETFGDPDTDGTGQDWEYLDSWAYKVGGAWTFGGVNCTDPESGESTTTTCDSGCPYPFAFCDNSDEVIAFLGSGNWRVQAEEGGHMGVGSGGAMWAEWWNANPWDKAATGLYDDGWTFSADGVMTHDTGDDGAIFGKKDAIDAAWPDNTPYAADNDDGEYEYYALADYTNTYTVSTAGEYDTVTLGSNGTIGFHTATAAQEYQILETGDGYVYFRNVGFDNNSWYGKFTTADYLSTDDNQILDMRIYPNPVDGNYVTILSPVNGVKYVELFDLNGRRIMHTSINNSTLDVSSISSGFYMIKVTIDGQSKVSKLVVR